MVAARHRKGVSRTWLARKSGVPKTTISGYESGRTLAGVYNLLCLADALDVSLDEYIGRSAGGDDEKKEADGK
jgi:transcriptional regulator with XRE-family HTH domain